MLPSNNVANDGQAASEQGGTIEFFMNIIPQTFVGAFSNGIMLQVILLSVLMGAVAAIHAAMTKRDVRSAIGWVGVIVLSPLLGALIGAVSLMFLTSPYMALTIIVLSLLGLTLPALTFAITLDRAKRTNTLIASAEAGSAVAKYLGLLAVVFASVNIFGGFAVTERMLAMYKKKERK